MIFCFLSLIGVASLIRGAVYLLFNHDLSKKAVTVILLDNDSYEMTIRSAVEQTKWKMGLPKNLIAVDNGLSPTAKREAKMLLNDYQIIIYNKDNIFEKLKEINKE